MNKKKEVLNMNFDKINVSYLIKLYADSITITII